MRVLIVDDSKVARMLIKSVFAKAGFECEFIEAEDGQSALVSVMESRPDLILTDYNMPNMSGLELVTTLRSGGVKTPIGVVTTQSTDAQRKRLEAAGADFHLSKPFEPDLLARTLKRLGLAPETRAAGQPARPMLLDWFVEGLLEVRLSFPPLRMERGVVGRKLGKRDLSCGVLVRAEFHTRTQRLAIFAGADAFEWIARQMLQIPASRPIASEDVADAATELGNMAMSHLLKRSESSLDTGALVKFQVQYLTSAVCGKLASRVPPERVEVLTGHAFELNVMLLVD